MGLAQIILLCVQYGIYMLIFRTTQSAFPATPSFFYLNTYSNFQLCSTVASETGAQWDNLTYLASIFALSSLRFPRRSSLTLDGSMDFDAISQAIEFALYSVNLANNLQPKDLMAAFNAVRTLRKPPECSARCWKLLVCTTYLQIAYLASQSVGSQQLCVSESKGI